MKTSPRNFIRLN